MNIYFHHMDSVDLLLCLIEQFNQKLQITLQVIYLTVYFIRNTWTPAHLYGYPIS